MSELIQRGFPNSQGTVVDQLLSPLWSHFLTLGPATGSFHVWTLHKRGEGLCLSRPNHFSMPLSSDVHLCVDLLSDASSFHRFHVDVLLCVDVNNYSMASLGFVSACVCVSVCVCGGGGSINQKK